ncbi:MAG TPA: hypothetical protein VN663_11230, partial [Ramlibacter sp.]|nr:hypothetical protein [Ramlibacter sp.]
PNLETPMRSFATALVLCIVTGAAGAQCNPAKSAWVDTSFVQELYSVSPQQSAPAAKRTVGPVVTAAVLAPGRTATATRTAAAAPQAKAPPEADFSRSDAALYAAIALMAAIALRRYGR